MNDQPQALGLEVQGLQVRYGGRVAVDGVDLRVPTGTVTGLIGPNGAGKTSTFNACSGLLTPAAGRVLLHGADITGLPPSERARRGLGRTFQRIALFDSLPVRDNVALGREAAMAGAAPLRQLWASRLEREEVREHAEAALSACGLSQVADRPAGSLSTGQRRLVELARVLAGRFGVLLLDEPSSGLDRNETAAFADVLGTAVHERDLAVLLVEHDMELALGTCARLLVLDFGRPVFEGTPDEVQASQIVRDAYLGSAA